MVQNTLIPRTLGSCDCLNSTKIWDTSPDFCFHQMEFSHQSDFTKTTFSFTKLASPKKFSHQNAPTKKVLPPNQLHQTVSTKILIFLLFLSLCLISGRCLVAPSGGCFQNYFFFCALPSLLPFAPLFHIVRPWWRPLVVDSWTKFFLGTPFLTSFCTPISYLHATMAPSGGEFRNKIFFWRTSFLTPM